MDDIEDELRSLPCSAPEAKAGLPTMVQLYLVDEGLKRNPAPREDFYRQFSATSEPPTPKDEPITPPPTYEESLQESKNLAAKVAKGLAQFYEGRVLLRREETEPRGDLEQDLNYWNSKIERWRDFGWPLFVEVGDRRRKELDGEAEKGYAEAMLLSPVQPQSHAPLDHGLQEAKQQSKLPTPKSDGSPDINMHSSQPLATTSQEPLKSTSGYNRDDPPTLPKGQKRKHSEVEHQEEKSLGNIRQSKRQRRGIATIQQKQEPVPGTKSTQGMGRNMPQLRSSKAHGGTRSQILSPPPPFSDTLGTNAQNRTGVRPPKQPTERILSKSYRKNSRSQQPNPADGFDSTSNVTRHGKVSHISLREDEGRSSNTTKPRKKQRKGTAKPLPANRLHSISTPGEGQGKKSWRVAKARTGGASRPKELQASRVLPWALRPRGPISYCEIGTRAA